MLFSQNTDITFNLSVNGMKIPVKKEINNNNNYNNNNFTNKNKNRQVIGIILQEATINDISSSELENTGYKTVIINYAVPNVENVNENVNEHNKDNKGELVDNDNFDNYLPKKSEVSLDNKDNTDIKDSKGSNGSNDSKGNKGNKSSNDNTNNKYIYNKDNTSNDKQNKDKYNDQDNQKFIIVKPTNFTNLTNNSTNSTNKSTNSTNSLNSKSKDNDDSGYIEPFTDHIPKLNNIIVKNKPDESDELEYDKNKYIEYNIRRDIPAECKKSKDDINETIENNNSNDPPHKKLSAYMLNVPGNCFYIKNLKKNQYITYNKNEKLSLKIFSNNNGTKGTNSNQVLCTYTNNKNGDINFCFQSDPSICLDGSKSEENKCSTSLKSRNFFINYTNKNKLNEDYSSFKFEKDLSKSKNPISSHVYFIRLKLKAEKDFSPITYENNVIKAVYDPLIIYDPINRQPKDIRMKWVIFLKSCSVCNDGNKK